jgi:hypothetical protein
VPLSWPFTTSSLAIHNKCRNHTPLGNQWVETMRRVVVCDSRYAQWKLPMLHSIATWIQLSEGIEKLSALVAQIHCLAIRMEGDTLWRGYRRLSKVMNQELHEHINYLSKEDCNWDEWVTHFYDFLNFCNINLVSMSLKKHIIFILD